MPTPHGGHTPRPDTYRLCVDLDQNVMDAIEWCKGHIDVKYNHQVIKAALKLLVKYIYGTLKEDRAPTTIQAIAGDDTRRIFVGKEGIRGITED